jgi:hypothetical protein
MKIRYTTFMLSITISVAKLYAYQADEKSCRQAPAFLQVGAFSHQQNLHTMQKRLRSFPLCMEKDGKIVRLFVALPHAKGTRRWYVKKIKSIVPDAFLKRKTLTYYRGGEGRKKTDSISDERLDAKAILQTRKKFF